MQVGRVRDLLVDDPLDGAGHLREQPRLGPVRTGCLHELGGNAKHQLLNTEALVGAPTVLRLAAEALTGRTALELDVRCLWVVFW